MSIRKLKNSGAILQGSRTCGEYSRSPMNDGDVFLSHPPRPLLAQSFWFFSHLHYNSSFFMMSNFVVSRTQPHLISSAARLPCSCSNDIYSPPLAYSICFYVSHTPFDFAASVIVFFDVSNWLTLLLPHLAGCVLTEHFLASSNYLDNMHNLAALPFANRGSTSVWLAWLVSFDKSRPRPSQMS